MKTLVNKPGIKIELADHIFDKAVICPECKGYGAIYSWHQSHWSITSPGCIGIGYSNYCRKCKGEGYWLD